ncbi:MAG: hypothetical protein KC464_28220 [Myxococcales bacterium]|nr:hypothetical protein [Myxococcales bacterium]
MAALTADRITKSRATGRSFTGDVAAATTIYLGSLVAKNAAGYIVPAADTAGLVVVGVAMAAVDNSAGGNGDLTVTIMTGVFRLENAAGAIVQASKHGLCYVADDQSVSTAAAMTNDVVAGIVDAIDTDGVWVAVGPEYGALA